MTAPDPFNLERFVAGQAVNYDDAVAELRRGAKTSHWIWYVFPQLKGLGFSRSSSFYGIASLDEARAYLQHPVLGARLLECVALVQAAHGRTISQILGSPDDLKFHSSMTLFALAAPGQPAFQAALDHFFDGNRDAGTVRLLGLSA